MSAFEVRSSEVEWDGRLSSARVDAVAMPDGSVAEREVVEHLDAVAVVALTDDDDVVLVRQYRHPLGVRQLELPAGLLDEDGEDPLDAVRRELAEETAMQVEQVRPLVRFANSAGWTDEHTTVYLGTGARASAHPDGFEHEHEEADMEVRLLPFHEAHAMARRGEITDAKTLVGLLLVGALRAAGEA